MLSRSANSATPEVASSREMANTSDLPSKKNLIILGANTLELSGTALQIASEITTFVAGMGFFIAPPLKKVYAELQGKNMHYSVNGNGGLCLENPNIPLPFSNSSMASNSTIIELSDNALCLEVADQTLLSSDILFNLPFPETLFAASVLLFSLGCSGLAVSAALKKYGSSLYETHEEMPPSIIQLTKAQKYHKLTSYLGTSLFIGSKVSAVYATSTISTSITLRHISGILQNFSIPSDKNFEYNLEEIINEIPELNNTVFFQIISLTMHFITQIDFTELRDAANIGSYKIDHSDYRIGLGMAVVALLLGFMALKVQQKSERYSDILLRHRYAQELKNQDQTLKTEQQSATSVINPNRMFTHANQLAKEKIQSDDLENAVGLEV